MAQIDKAPPPEPLSLWFVGQHESIRAVPATSELLGKAQGLGYDMLTAPITTAHFQSRVIAQTEVHLESLSGTSTPNVIPSPLISPLTPEDTDLGPEDSNSALIAVTSSWIDLGSEDPLIADVSRQVFNLEIAYAAFCGIQNVMITGPLSGSNEMQYARALLEALGMGPYLQLHVLLPMTGELDPENGEGTHLAELVREQFASLDVRDGGVEDLAEFDKDADTKVDLTAKVADTFGAWDTWNAIRTMCDYNSRLSIALEIPRHIPQESVQSRWYSEPVRSLMFPRTSFLRNAKGFPVLHKSHQQYLTRLMRLRYPPWILLSDVGPIDNTEEEVGSAYPTLAEAATNKPKDPVPHLRYLRHLQQTQPSRPPIERFGQGYQDYMQSPLQPLTDNLESITYEVFEKDPIKYDWYERAVALALTDLSAKVGNDKDIIVAVVGAGRGPLVSKAILASQSSGVKAKFWAVEKNQNAYVHLQRRNATDKLWNNQVTVVKTDMRAWKGPIIGNETRKVDILISELLGSFADNELSPECLDGVQHVLDPDHGVNVPQSYSAHITPIATPRLHNDLLSRPGTDKWDIPTVVMFQQYDFLSTLANGGADIKETWAFSHPVPPAILAQAEARRGGSAEFGGAGGAVGGDGSNEHNYRFSKTRFLCKDRGTCHGLAGYFESVLYASDGGDKVELSTNPVTMEDKSKDMISWFPIFFPLKTPLHIPDNAEVEVSMWRQTDDRKVWYEWIVEVFGRVNGKKLRLAMSDLHTSRKHGCLM